MNDAQRAARKAQRLALIEARIDLPQAVRAAADRQLSGHLATLLARLDPPSLGLCWPYRAEPDLRDWVHAALGAFRRTAKPEKKTAVKKTAAKKPAEKKVAVKKPAPKKPAAKKPAAKKKKPAKR